MCQILSQRNVKTFNLIYYLSVFKNKAKIDSTHKEKLFLHVLGSALSQHMYAQHGDKRYLCPELNCPRMFHSSVTLVKHANRFHPHIPAATVRAVKATAFNEAPSKPVSSVAATAAASVFDAESDLTDSGTTTATAYGGPFMCPVANCAAVFRVTQSHNI